MEALPAYSAEYVEQVLLTAEAGNLRAIKFYQQHGFRTIGTIQRAILVDDRYLMSCRCF